MTEDARGPQALPYERPSLRQVTGEQLREILRQHRRWLESEETAERDADSSHPHFTRREGRQADLSRAQLAGADLSKANLRRALLSKTNLTGADLSLADLTGAELVRANLEEAYLLGTKLQGADLQGASLQGATGLTPGQLAGANLSAAALPPTVEAFEALEQVNRAGNGVRRLFLALLLVCAYCGLVIFNTTDLQLLTNASTPPFSYLGVVVPLVGFYLMMPLALVALYITFHFYLQRLWELLAQLPAIFPDGRSLDEKAERWLLLPMVRVRVPWVEQSRPLRSPLEKAVVLLLAYWVVPATLLLFWARDLTRQDLHSAMLHVVLVVASMGFGFFAHDLAGKTLGGRSSSGAQSSTVWGRRSSLLVTVGLLLAGISFGVLYGDPHDSSHAPEVEATSVRRWAAHALWAFGYSPYADLTQSDVSSKPADWVGSGEEIAQVSGARLGQLSLRYAQGYRVFLVKADLWNADLRGAYLSEADLRAANLRQAELQSAVLDRARLSRANLDEARLEGANLARADLQEAKLSYASLAGATLVDANLEGASFYAAELPGAQLMRANLSNADLRHANLERARLTHADLRKALLWSAQLAWTDLRDSRLQQAYLIRADLRGSDLRGAELAGATFDGADLSAANLSGANLAGANFVGAHGLEARQVCSARQHTGVQLDEALWLAVQAECGLAPVQLEPAEPAPLPQPTR